MDASFVKIILRNKLHIHLRKFVLKKIPTFFRKKCIPITCECIYSIYILSVFSFLTFGQYNIDLAISLHLFFLISIFLYSLSFCLSFCFFLYPYFYIISPFFSSQLHISISHNISLSISLPFFLFFIFFTNSLSSHMLVSISLSPIMIKKKAMITPNLKTL